MRFARPGRVVILGEVENEDTVPAYLNVNATLLKADGSPLEEEGSFDLISHVLLPKQVSPYRIDFPGMRMDAGQECAHGCARSSSPGQRGSGDRGHRSDTEQRRTEP